MKCATHPDVETNLRCGKCDKPICPRCMVNTPVGARCRECARLRRLPMYEISARHYARALASGLVVGVVVGILWGFLWWIVPFLYLNIIIAVGAGYAVGELVTLSVNRKRGVGLQFIAGLGVVVSYVVANFDLIHGVFILSLTSLLNLWGLIALAAAMLMAISRLR
ncbi:MAG: hypothetical protein HY669_01140 [Chloroflexi bacterium]|nr:hypothetical protein [Chloroflexota bacterium]